MKNNGHIDVYTSPRDGNSNGIDIYWNGPSQMFYDSSRSREDPLTKSECKERIQEPKMVRQRAAWKSYIDGPSVLKKQSNVMEKIEDAPKPSQSVKSEFSLPPFRRKRSSPTCSHQGDCHSETRLEQLPKVSQGRNCDTPATSMKSLPNLSAKRPRRHKVGGMCQKDPSLSRLGIQVDALENITTRIKTLSKRFHSPVKQVRSLFMSGFLVIVIIVMQDRRDGLIFLAAWICWSIES